MVESKVYKIGDFIGPYWCPKEVLKWADNLSGFPYGVSNDVITIREEIEKLKAKINVKSKKIKELIKKTEDLKDKKIKGLDEKIKKLEEKLKTNKDPSKISDNEELKKAKDDLDVANKELSDANKELSDANKELSDANKELSDANKGLSDALNDFWQGGSEPLKDLVKNKLGIDEGDKKFTPIISAIKNSGIVCNTYVEVVMRMSGFTEFPITHSEYKPKTVEYKDIAKSRPGILEWQLHWAERMVDWVSQNGQIVYSETTKEKLPPPKCGDIVIFGREPNLEDSVPKGLISIPKHVNLVVVFGGKFNFAGAAHRGKCSDTKHWTGGFEEYKPNMPKEMAQVNKYLWILRPNYSDYTIGGPD